MSNLFDKSTSIFIEMSERIGVGLTSFLFIFLFFITIVFLLYLKFYDKNKSSITQNNNEYIDKSDLLSLKNEIADVKSSLKSSLQEELAGVKASITTIEHNSTYHTKTIIEKIDMITEIIKNVDFSNLNSVSLKDDVDELKEIIKQIIEMLENCKKSQETIDYEYIINHINEVKTNLQSLNSKLDYYSSSINFFNDEVDDKGD